MTASPSAARAPWGRLAITIALLLLVGLKPAVGLPGVDTSGMEGRPTESAIDLFGLGIMPFLSAAFLVELVALLRPRWRALRHGGPEGRGKLGRAMWIVTVGLCVFQGFAIVKMAQSLASIQTVALTSTFSVFGAVLSLTAATCLLGLLAQLAGGYGIAGGFAVLSVGLPLFPATRHLAAGVVNGVPSPADLGVLAVLSAAVVATTAYALRIAPARVPLTSADPGYREAPGAAPPPPFAVPVPASGVAPLVVAASLLMFPATFARMGLPIPGALALERDTPYRVASLILLALGALFFTWVFNAPARVAALVARADESRAAATVEVEARAGMREAWLRSLTFLVVLFAIAQLAGRYSGLPAGASGLALLTALGLDLVAEWRARAATPELVPVWPEHRSYAVPIARHALAAAGITLHARGEHLHRLLQFYGPYAPVDLMVPRADAERAAELLQKILYSDPDAPEAEAEPKAERPRRPWTRAESSMLAGVLALAVGMVLLPGAAPAVEKVTRPARPEALQLLAVDDEADPFEAVDPASLPAGASIQLENTPLGKDEGGLTRTAVRHYARIVKGEQETMDQARARLLAWAATQPLAAGDRVLAGPVTEYDDAADRLEIIGYRTHLVKGAAIIDGSRVSGARVAPDAGAGRSGWHVGVELDPEGAERFRAFTAANVKRRLAIVVDGVVESAPVIQAEIPGGQVVVSMGNATDPEQQQRDAQRLAQRLLGR
jgi:preprotein translocase subunit SecY